MKFQEIVSPTMKELFIKQIETRILTGELQPGDKLPTERDMAEQMKVSRTITNAGLVELQRKGFVEVRPRQGTFIADYKRNGTLDVLTAIMQFNGGKFDKRTFDSLMDFRRLLMGECAFHAAVNRTEEDLSQLEEYVAKLAECNTVERAARLKLDYDYLIANASGNVVYPIILKSFDVINLHFNHIIYKQLGSAHAKEGVAEMNMLLRDKKQNEAKVHIITMLNVRVEALSSAYYE